jgi:hypothetical protein
VKCPHCAKNLQRKQRVGAKCSSCRKAFALDPKENSVLLHDLRVRGLADRLSDGGRLWYTVAQFHHAAARKPARARRKSIIGNSIAVILFGGIAIALLFVQPAFAILPGLLAAGNAIAVLVRLAGRRRIILPMSRMEVRRDIIRRWRNVYQSDPPGLVDEGGYDNPNPPAAPMAALLCPDPGVIGCLAANGIGEWVALATDNRRIPERIPVVIMHDASPQGYQFSVTMRRLLAGREVRVAGIRPHMVMDNKNALRLRTKVDHGTIAAITTGELTEREIRWLAKGWWVPLASVPPAKLIAAATRAVQRVTRDQTRAEQVGFLSWPA